MTCGCEVTLSKGMDDVRADIWLKIFGKLSFPLKHPIPFLNPNFQGKTFYAGDASALTLEQRKCLIETMSKKFNVSEAEIEASMKDGVIPILSDNLILSICQTHMLGMLDFSDEDSDDEFEEDDYGTSEEEG